ncbi:hypothetical protein TVAG_429690 [Trichomonas vaginalis G3]|uniref:Uncharacterized protein n=1 Tax=Trichomonas vaginalis (strain ATCC PRA-98 / G3) TaxID=412133 RepID=A2FKM9_TRIV3|nr:hypothetical protein TVAGG3_0403170 [Trichomonas vaginalis G3]EAX94527.1 hypothetical protein TVAG_429690 [Trichomonas vaginalis G3]KAI5534843.1 hypothetical protein TVAGG3_0403170 [Trichomonas vaginalis G3]|eukprot:XP_001307457.1 hypothetical protein [Trichomonas vaginalis G3]
MKKFLSFLKLGPKEDDEEDQRMMASPDEFIVYINEPIEEDLNEVFIEKSYKSYRYFHKGKPDKASKAMFTDKFNQVIALVRNFYITNLNNIKILRNSQYMYQFVKHVDYKIANEIIETFLDKYITPIKQKLNNIIQLYTEKQATDGPVFTYIDERIKIISLEFENFQEYKNNRDFVLCKAYQDIHDIAKQAEDELPQIFSQDVFKKLYDLIIQIISNQTNKICELLLDPVTVSCAYFQVLKLSKSSKSAKLSVLFHVILTLFYGRLTKLYGYFDFMRIKSIQITTDDEMMLKIVPHCVVLSKILSIYPDSPLDDFNKRFLSIFADFCGKITTYNHDNYSEIMFQLFKVIDDPTMRSYMRHSMRNRSINIFREVFSNYLPAFQSILKKGNIDDNKQMMLARLELNMMLKPALIMLINIIQGMFIDKYLPALQNESVDVMKETALETVAIAFKDNQKLVNCFGKPETIIVF